GLRQARLRESRSLRARLAVQSVHADITPAYACQNSVDVARRGRRGDREAGRRARRRGVAPLTTRWPARSPSVTESRSITTPLVRSHPDPTANAAASTPPATPDAAPAPTARTRPDPDLRLLDPIVEGVRDAVIERHRPCGVRASRQPHRNESGASGAKQNP